MQDPTTTQTFGIGSLTLVGVISAALTFIAGMWAAIQLQDRERRLRRLDLVRAISTEVERIHAEIRLEHVSDDSVQDWESPESVRAAIPGMASWVENVPAEVASTAPDVMPKLYGLDRRLREFHESAEALGRLDTEIRRVRLRLRDEGVAIQMSSVPGHAEHRRTTILPPLQTELAEFERQRVFLVEQTNSRYQVVIEALDALRSRFSALDADLGHSGWGSLRRRRIRS
jgi:hypothetical protein